MNPFLNLLLSRGFTEGTSGRWFSPDSRRGDGVVVELQGKNAVAVWKGGRTLFESSVPRDVEKFRQEVR
jgi:hypothetical protein